MSIKTFFNNFDWSFLSILKVFWAVLLWFLWLWIIFSLVFWMLNLFWSLIFDWWSRSYDSNRYAQEPYAEKSISSIDESYQDMWDELTEEDFEIKEHSATIKTSNVSSYCSDFLRLKERNYVIVERSNVSEERCDFRFKTLKENSQELVDFIEKYDLDYFNTNIYSIKRSVENLESELSILEKKLSSVEETLTNAQESYDELIILAKDKEDIESLTKLIDWKLNLINKLTQERQNINTQIIRIKKSQAEQLDRLKYTFFNVNIYQDKIIDFKQIKESWKNDLKNLVEDFNNFLQWVSLSLLSYLIRFAQFAIYLFISVFLIRFLWFVVKKIWFIWSKTKTKR